MNLAGRFACAIAVATAFVPVAFAGHSHVPTPSTWTLNVKESDFGGGPTMKSDVYVMLTDTEKWLKYTEVTVDGDGVKTSYSWSGAPDGKMHPVVGLKGASASFNVADDMGHIVMPDGSVVDEEITYSADKKKSILIVVLKDKSGKVFHQKWVYDRTK